MRNAHAMAARLSADGRLTSSFGRALSGVQKSAITSRSVWRHARTL